MLITPVVTISSATARQVSSEYYRIREVTTGGNINTIAGTSTAGYSGDGGPDTAAQINGVQGVTIDSQGTLYLADAGNARIRTLGFNGALSFAEQAVGTTGSAVSATITNVGTETLTFNADPVVSGDFVIASCNTCGTASSTLAAGAGCALAVEFQPTEAGTRTGTVTITNNGVTQTQQITLSGTADKGTPTITLASSENPSTYGDTVTFTTTLPTPTSGTITFMDGSTALGTGTVCNGSATYSTSLLTAGSHLITAVYSGDDNWSGATSASVTQVVNQATPTLTWPTPAPISYGTALSGTQLDAVATGVTGTTLAGGYTYTPGSGTVLNAGTQTLSVAFVPNDSTDYKSIGATTTLTVNKATTSVALVANPNPAMQGTTGTLTATVTGARTPSGTVIFLSGSNTLCTTTLNASGVATCSFTPSASGALSITAQYQGDPNHLASSASLSLSVYDAAIIQTFNRTQLVYPGATNLTVCVTGATSATTTGTIQVMDGGALLTTISLQGNGCGYWYISPGLSAGTHSITSVYSGDTNNQAGTSLPTVLTVNPVPVNLSASCWSTSNYDYGTDYQCTVTASSNAGAAQGNITYSYDGGAATAVALSNGNAQFSVAKPLVGAHSVVIGYAQQTNYAAATSQTESFTIASAPVQVALTPSTWYTSVGSSITFQAAVSSWSAGAPNSTGSVSFYDGSTLLATAAVDGSGTASFSTASLSAGSHTITATYAGGTNYATASGNVTITLAQ
ncbi:Ig-like domain repeat protein [Telmatobacter bradus]|uniref:Ig-like domain repeat protein n=1 Tax=Telmatobacter bradus TaxID=474953 RepID=UPI003B434E62